MLYTIHPFPFKVNTMNYVFDGFLQVVFHDWEGRDNCFLYGQDLSQLAGSVLQISVQRPDNTIDVMDPGKNSPTIHPMEVP
jgi:hypothetical protein